MYLLSLLIRIALAFWAVCEPPELFAYCNSLFGVELASLEERVLTEGFY